MLLVCAATILVAACGSDDDGDAVTDAGAVTGTVWVLEELSGDAVPAGVTVTLEYDGEQVAGTGGCNRYRSGATFDDGRVEIAPEIVATRMACAEPASTVEQDYLATLPDASTFEITDDRLTIADADSVALLAFRASDGAPEENVSG